MWSSSCSDPGSSESELDPIAVRRAPSRAPANPPALLNTCWSDEAPILPVHSPLSRGTTKKKRPMSRTKPGTKRRTKSSTHQEEEATTHSSSRATSSTLSQTKRLSQKVYRAQQKPKLSEPPTHSNQAGPEGFLNNQSTKPSQSFLRNPSQAGPQGLLSNYLS